MKALPGCFVTADEKQHHGKKWMPAMYVAYFGIFQELANKHGYALCVHGSVVRDFDLIAVPFDVTVSPHIDLLTDIRNAVGIESSSDPIFDIVGYEPQGRTCYTIELGGGGYLDISFTPSLQEAIDRVVKDEVRMIEIKRMVQCMDDAELARRTPQLTGVGLG